jgi:hypothetical protein
VQRAEQFGGNQRRVACGNQHMGRFGGQVWDGLHHGVPCAELLGLQSVEVLVAQRALHFVCAMPHHHDNGRDARRLQRVQHIAGQRLTQQRRNRLRAIRLHAGALSRRHHDCRKHRQIASRPRGELYPCAACGQQGRVAHLHNAGNSMSLLCPGNILAVGSMMLLAWLTAVDTSPTPVAINFNLPACVHTSPAA